MSVVIPYTFVGGAGHKARAAEVNANFNAIASKFVSGTGGIDNSDIAPNAGIEGSKISNVASTRLTTDHLEDLAVTNAKLAVGAALANLAAGSVAKDKLKLGSVALTIPGLSIGSSTTVDTGITTSTGYALKVERTGSPSGAIPSFVIRVDGAGKYWIDVANPSNALSVVSHGASFVYFQLT